MVSGAGGYAAGSRCSRADEGRLSPEWESGVAALIPFSRNVTHDLKRLMSLLESRQEQKRFSSSVPVRGDI